VPESESSWERCPHCDINEVVREHIEGNDPVNLPELVAKMGESLVELILLGPEEQWRNLLAEAIRDIGEVFLEKSSAVESDTTHWRCVAASRIQLATTARLPEDRESWQGRLSRRAPAG